MTGVHYIENETQTQVSVDAAYGWDPLGVVMVVTYPSGHRYALRQVDFDKHFTIVSPQTIQVSGSNTHVARPTDEQRQLQGDGT